MPRPFYWRYFAALVAAGLAGIAALAMFSRALAQPPLDLRLQSVAAAVLMTFITSAAIAWFLSRRTARSQRAFVDVCQRIADDGLMAEPRVDGADGDAEMVAAFNAMSERVSQEFTRLAQDRQQLRAILGGMSEGVVALDSEQRILFANERAGSLLELQVESSLGLRFWEVVRKRPLVELVGRAMSKPEAHQEEIVWNGQTTRTLTVHVARLPGLPVPGARPGSEPPRGAVMVLHDTSELKRLERLRSDFVANVSHELKTPLAIIKACVETLVDGAADDPRHRTAFLEKITDQSDRLQALILDLLSLARIESGAEAFEFQSLLLAPVVEACVHRHGARAAANQLRLFAEPPKPSSGESEDTIAAWADEEAVNQILDNLVDNALKYTLAGGKVVVRWRAEGEQVWLEVEDTGVGIPPADLPRVFERFYRVDKARSRELGGTGLGLSIVKHLAHAMRGGVSATSEIGRGAKFQVRLMRASA